MLAFVPHAVTYFCAKWKNSTNRTYTISIPLRYLARKMNFAIFFKFQFHNLAYCLQNETNLIEIDRSKNAKNKFKVYRFYNFSSLINTSDC
jgi:hypothetical protein